MEIVIRGKKEEVTALIEIILGQRLPENKVKDNAVINISTTPSKEHYDTIAPRTYAISPGYDPEELSLLD